MSRSGFTFIELIVVMGVIGILLMFVTVNLLGLSQRPTLTASVETLTADIRQQQIKAMAGVAASSYGIYVGSTNYVLFAGTTYNPNDPTNSTVSFGERIVVVTIFPGNQIVFASGSGEIVNFSSGNNTVALFHTDSNEQKTMELNRYGTITGVY